MQGFIGRERELAQLDLQIGPGDDGLRLVLLTGPSGLGKTTLAQAAMQTAANRGYNVAHGAGRAGSLSAPFAPWCEALPQLREIVDTAAAGVEGIDFEQLGTALVALLTELAVDKPLLLAFDDAQALDESSLALLPYAAGVSERLNLTLMLIEQNDAVGVSDTFRSFVDGLVARRVVQHYELGPMSDEATALLVANVLDIAVEEVPSEIVLRAGGNPWFAKELAQAHKLGDDVLPVSISAAATSRLHRLDEAARDVVFAIAICPEGAYIGWLEALAELKPREFARMMEAIKNAGLVREDGDIVSIAHPLMRQALGEELSAAMRRALHQELAATISTVPMAEAPSARAQGYHLARAGKPDEAVAQYLRAAEANEVMGQLHEVVADLARALEAEPRVENRADLLKRCAFAAMQVGDERTGEYWAELARLAAANHDNELYAYALVQQYWTAYKGDQADWLDRAASLGPNEYGWSARAAAILATLEGDYEKAVGYDQRALELARERGDMMLETLALDKLGNAYAYLERMDDSIESLRQAITLAVQQRLHSWALLAWGSLSESLGENLEPDKALAEARAALKYVDDLSLNRQRSMVEGWLARNLVRCGHVSDALEHAETAAANETRYALDRGSAIVHVLRALVAADAGSLELLAATVPVLREASDKQGYTSWVFEADFAEARVKAQSGDLAAAVTFAESLEINEPASRASVAQWLVRLGIAESHDGLVEAAGRLAAGVVSEVPLVKQMVLEVTATQAVKDGASIDQLITVADEWARVGRPLEALRCMTTVGMLQAGSDAKGAIERLREIRTTFADMGVGYDADLVAAKLRGLGARSRARSRVTNVGNLTKRELEIARLVASGMRNAEVAGQLFLAEKTVAAHLSNIYGKLEVKSRVQLAAWLKDHDSESIVA